MFGGMFNFMMMQPEPIARFELPDVFGRQGLIVDTCGGINDSEHEYETAVAHPSYNNGEWIIVEGYDTEEDALNGHNKWVKIMTAESKQILFWNYIDTTLLEDIKPLEELSIEYLLKKKIGLE